MPATLRLTDALADSLADAVRRGVPVETAAQAAGVSSAQYFAWLRAAETGLWQHGDPVPPDSLRTIQSFADKIARARAEHMEQMIASIQQCAVTPNEKTGLPDWRAADTMLSKHPVYRKVWREERQVNVTQSGTVQHEHQMASKLPDAELEQAYAALKALPANSD